MRTQCDGSERTCSSGTCSGRQPLSGFFHLMFLAIQMQAVELINPYRTISTQVLTGSTTVMVSVVKFVIAIVIVVMCNFAHGGLLCLFVSFR